MPSRSSSLELPVVTYVTNDISTTSYLNTDNVAHYLGVSSGLLRMWRLRKTGPRYFKMPGKRGAVYYHAADVFAYMAAHSVLTERMPNRRTGPLPGSKKRSKEK